MGTCTCSVVIVHPANVIVAIRGDGGMQPLATGTQPHGTAVGRPNAILGLLMEWGHRDREIRMVNGKS